MKRLNIYLDNEKELCVAYHLRIEHMPHLLQPAIRPSVDGLYRDGTVHISHVRCINDAL